MKVGGQTGSSTGTSPTTGDETTSPRVRHAHLQAGTLATIRDLVWLASNQALNHGLTQIDHHDGHLSFSASVLVSSQYSESCGIPPSVFLHLILGLGEEKKRGRHFPCCARHLRSSGVTKNVSRTHIMDLTRPAVPSCLLSRSLYFGQLGSCLDSSPLGKKMTSRVSRSPRAQTVIFYDPFTLSFFYKHGGRPLSPGFAGLETTKKRTGFELGLGAF